MESTDVSLEFSVLLDMSLMRMEMLVLVSFIFLFSTNNYKHNNHFVKMSTNVQEVYINVNLAKFVKMDRGIIPANAHLDIKLTLFLASAKI